MNRTPVFALFFGKAFDTPLLFFTLRQKKVERPAYEPSLRTQVKIDELRKSINERNLQFSGYLTIYNIVDPSLPKTRELYHEIEDDYLADTNDSKSKQSIFK